MRLISSVSRDTIARSSPWNREVLVLFGATFLAYANISVFFFFYEYLHTLPIDPKWFGLLISIFSAVSLIARPLAIPFFHRGNAYRFLSFGTVLLALVLCSYSVAMGFRGMMIVRALHGLAFVLVGAALMTILVDHIPRERSAQFFGLISIIILIPNTLIPPILPLLSHGLGGFPRVLILFGALTLLVLPLVRSAGAKGPAPAQRHSERPSGREILMNLRDPQVLSLLGAMLLLYSAYAFVFFFLDGFGRSLGIGNTGFFLTLATAGEIGVRLGGGSFFDKTHKGRLAALTLLGLCVAYLVLGRVQGVFFPVGLLLGIGWGIAMPVFNGMIFDMSKPKLRAFNTNLGFQMFQGGFFLGPFLGGFLVSRWGYGTLFDLCGLFSILSALLVLSMKGAKIGSEAIEERSGDERIRN
jgi:predicted MFS family arabinose efflux permease